MQSIHAILGENFKVMTMISQVLLDEGHPQYIDKKGRIIETLPFYAQTIIAHLFTSILPCGDLRGHDLLQVS